MNEHFPPPRLWPLASVAARLNVEKNWLRAELSAGRLPGIPTGSGWLLDPLAVEAALLARVTSVDRLEEQDAKSSR